MQGAIYNQLSPPVSSFMGIEYSAGELTILLWGGGFTEQHNFGRAIVEMRQRPREQVCGSDKPVMRPQGQAQQFTANTSR